MNTKEYLRFTGAKIKALRKEKKLTQKQLADLCGVSHSFISHVENGTSAISTEKLQAVAKALNVNAGNLLPDAQIDYIEPPTSSKRKLLIEYIRYLPDSEIERLVKFFEMFVDDPDIK